MKLSVMNRNDLGLLELKLCDVQGRLFEKALGAKLDGRKFAKVFMNSEIAAHLDMDYSFYQWSGEEYILDELLETKGDSLFVNNKECADFGREEMYWAGYIYRFWHYYTGETSRSICKKAPPQVVMRNYPMLHTMTPELAVETFKEVSLNIHPDSYR